MKFSIIAAVVLLALAQGSFAQDAADLAKFSQYFEELKNKMTEMISNQDLANQAKTFLEERKTQLEPLASQLQSIATNVEEQIRPLAANVQAQMQAQMQPAFENIQREMETIFQKITEQAKALGN